MKSTKTIWDILLLELAYLIIEDDPEYGQPIGTEVSEERVMECFLNDLQIQTMSVADCMVLTSGAIFHRRSGRFC